MAWAEADLCLLLQSVARFDVSKFEKEQGE